MEALDLLHGVFDDGTHEDDALLRAALEHGSLAEGTPLTPKTTDCDALLQPLDAPAADAAQLRCMDARHAAAGCLRCVPPACWRDAALARGGSLAALPRRRCTAAPPPGDARRWELVGEAGKVRAQRRAGRSGHP